MIKLENTTPIKGRNILLAVFAALFGGHALVSMAADAAFPENASAQTAIQPIAGSPEAFAAQYGVPVSSVSVLSQPHDCQFETAPIGEKWCHYEHATSVFVTNGKSERLYQAGDDMQHGSLRYTRVVLGWEKIQD